MTRNELIKSLKARLASSLRSLGYASAGKFSLVRRSDNNFGIIDIQLHTRQMDPLRANFTINIGCGSGILIDFFSGIDFFPARHPEIGDCVVTERLGRLTPISKDLWWEISDSSLKGVSDEIEQQIISYGLPFIDANINDENMKDAWLSLFNRDPSALGMPRLRYLAVLLSAAGAESDLDKVLEYMLQSGRPGEGLIDLKLFALNLRTHGLAIKPIPYPFRA